ncbi:MAG: hypothetical protein KGL00_01195 [Gammaproteobacteria bacterium]|nr:hypothetical protein [Gammaproteobacteria bacterium]MDE2139203.1 hypothetical protein [Gammaproteobacteria bacterium]MDE2272787.1 hypothetical protein [Gammaproteobacteria bacterium]
MRKITTLTVVIFGLFADACLANNPYLPVNNTSQFRITSCGQVTSLTDSTGIMSEGMNMNFLVALTAVNYLKAHVPANLLAPYLGPSARPYDRLNFYQSVLVYLQGYCQAHPFVSFDTAEQALALELTNNHS